MSRKDAPIPLSLKKGLYRHNKTGNLYEVLGVALHTESSEQMVIYRAKYEPASDDVQYELFARPYAMFTELVTIGGQTMPRFEHVDAPRSFLA